MGEPASNRPAAYVPTSNTRECFSTFIGLKVTGVIFDALPLGRRDIAQGTRTLIFEDGRGLTLSSRGSYWVESATDIDRAVRAKARALTAAGEELAGVLALAGRETPDA